MSACSTSKNLVGTTPIPNRQTTELIQASHNHNIDFDWYCAKGKARFDTEEVDVGTKIYLRMKKDSIIWITIKKLGITAVQSLITPDSFFVIHRLERAYEKGSLQSMQKRYDINQTFGEIQNYLAGNIPTPVDTNTRSSVVERSYLLESIVGDYKVFSYINPFNMRVSEARAVDNKNNEIKVQFDKYKKSNNGAFLPYKRTFFVKFDSGYGHENSTIKFDFSEILIDEPKKTNFRIPKHYEDISID